MNKSEPKWFNHKISFRPIDISLVNSVFLELLDLFDKTCIYNEIDRRILVNNYDFKKFASLTLDELIALTTVTQVREEQANTITGLWLLCYVSYYSEIDLIGLIDRWITIDARKRLNFTAAPQLPPFPKADIFYFSCLLALNVNVKLLQLIIELPDEVFNELNFTWLFDNSKDSLILKIYESYPQRVFVGLFLKLPDALFNQLNINLLFFYHASRCFTEDRDGKELTRKLFSRISALPEEIIQTIHFVHAKSSSMNGFDEITLHDTNFSTTRGLINNLNWVYFVESDPFLSFFFKWSAEQLKQWHFFFKTESTMDELGYPGYKLLELHSFRWDVVKSKKSDQNFFRLLGRARKMGEGIFVHYCLFDLARSWPMSETSSIAYLNVTKDHELLYTNSRFALANYYLNKQSNGYADRISNLLSALEYSLEVFFIKRDTEYESLARIIIQTLDEYTFYEDSPIDEWFETSITLLKQSNTKDTCYKSITEFAITDFLMRVNNQFMVDRLEQLELDNKEYTNELNEMNDLLDKQQQQIAFLLTLDEAVNANVEINQEKNKSQI